MSCYRCKKGIANPLYCGDCSNEISDAYARWDVKEITDVELHNILDKYEG